MATAPPAYDDGSSTESEYYFDPAEEAEELAAYAWTHALDASASPSQPESDKVNAKITIKQEFSAASDESDEIALPQGSEWSHGAVYDDAVERALAMASRFEREMSNTQREEAMTADTMNGYEQEQEQEQVKAEPERKTLVRTLSSSGEVERKKVKVKSRIVSLKSVKATTPPASVTNSVVVGLRRPPTKLVGAPSELVRGLSVARPQWRATSSQSSSSQKASPTFGKSLQAKKREKVMGVPVEKSSSSSVCGKETEKVSLSRRIEHSKTSPRRRSRSPSRRRAEGSSRTDRSKSLAGRSPRSRQREENRWRSRSSYRSATSASPRHRGIDSPSRSPYQYDSETRSSGREERSRSPPRVVRYKSRSRSRSRDRGRYDHHEGSRQIQQGSVGGRSSRHDSPKTDLDARYPCHRESSTSRGTQNTTITKHPDGHHNQDRNRVQTARTACEKEVPISSKQGRNQTNSRCDVKTGETPIRRGTERGASKPRSHKPDPPRTRPGCKVLAEPAAIKTTKRSPREPRIKSQPVESPSRHNTRKNPPTIYRRFDDFERQVHKLKLREADLNEQEAARARDPTDSRFFGNRRRGIASEKARLEAQDFERFEKLYESMAVSKEELKTYQTRREFAYRVVCYKRKQAALQEEQEQTGVFRTPEEIAVQWHRLDEEREQLIRENGELFHNVMMGQHEPSRAHQLCSEPNDPGNAGKRPRSLDVRMRQHFLKRIKKGLSDAHQQLDASSSRVVVGASLQFRTGGKPLPPQPSNTPWFLKG